MKLDKQLITSMMEAQWLLNGMKYRTRAPRRNQKLNPHNPRRETVVKAEKAEKSVTKRIGVMDGGILVPLSGTTEMTRDVHPRQRSPSETALLAKADPKEAQKAVVPQETTDKMDLLEMDPVTPVTPLPPVKSRTLLLQTPHNNHRLPQIPPSTPKILPALAPLNNLPLPHNPPPPPHSRHSNLLPPAQLDPQLPTVSPLPQAASHTARPCKASPLPHPNPPLFPSNPPPILPLPNNPHNPHSKVLVPTHAPAHPNHNGVLKIRLPLTELLMHPPRLR
jgi:hypothetical protein